MSLVFCLTGDDLCYLANLFACAKGSNFYGICLGLRLSEKDAFFNLKC